MRRVLPALSVLILTIACFHVVVNVYFPESEAKGALASLEDELLKGVPATKPTAPATPANPAPAPPEKGDKSGGQASLLPVGGLFAPTPVFAAGPVSEEDIRNRIKGMPEVVEAYERISARMARVDALRDRGLAGEGSDGLLSARGEIADRKDQRTLDDENADRKVVIKGLARATVQAQGLPASEDNLNQVMDSARATFAGLRRDKAKPGWWIQMPDGSWKKK
jgi:hypothetical protein